MRRTTELTAFASNATKRSNEANARIGVCSAEDVLGGVQNRTLSPAMMLLLSVKCSAGLTAATLGTRGRLAQKYVVPA